MISSHETKNHDNYVKLFISIDLLHEKKIFESEKKKISMIKKSSNVHYTMRILRVGKRSQSFFCYVSSIYLKLSNKIQFIQLNHRGLHFEHGTII